MSKHCKFIESDEVAGQYIVLVEKQPLGHMNMVEIQTRSITPERKQYRHQEDPESPDCNEKGNGKSVSNASTVLVRPVEMSPTADMVEQMKFDDEIIDMDEVYVEEDQPPPEVTIDVSDESLAAPNQAPNQDVKLVRTFSVILHSKFDHYTKY